MSQADVEAFATAQLGAPIFRGRDGRWLAIDKGKLGMGASTPNPSNQWPARQHWFLIDSRVEVALVQRMGK